MSRKDMLRSMLSRRDEKLPDGNPPNEKAAEPGNRIPLAPSLPLPPISHMRSGAVGAMGRSLGQIANAAEQAKALIATGASVVELPVDVLDASFVADRLPGDGPDYERLVEAIRESGQRSPVLVRPHPDKPGRYQIAFGHRRVRALAQLGRPVRAVVQNLSDEELVVIQGQENSARADLSYIERGLFALALEERGFDRKVVMSALGLEKTQLSKLMGVMRAIPRATAMAIGPAPKAGRPRWETLAERLCDPAAAETLDRILASSGFQDLDTDARFMKIFNALARPVSKASIAPSVVLDEAGRTIATIERTGTRVALVVDERDNPEFGAYLAAELPRLLKTYRNRRDALGGPAAES